MEMGAPFDGLLVKLTYFTPLSSCGNSLRLLKSSSIDCKFIKIASIHQAKVDCDMHILVSTPFVTVLVN